MARYGEKTLGTRLLLSLRKRLGANGHIKHGIASHLNNKTIRSAASRIILLLKHLRTVIQQGSAEGSK